MWGRLPPLRPRPKSTRSPKRMSRPQIIPAAHIADVAREQWMDLAEHSRDHGAKKDCRDCDRFQRAIEAYCNGDEPSRAVLLEIFEEPKAT